MKTIKRLLILILILLVITMVTSCDTWLMMPVASTGAW